MQSFPKPLSAKEEKECIARCRQGDQKARQCLIEKNLRLVAYIAKKYNVGDKDMDDLISIGTIGLIKGIDTFDETKNIRLATYAARCIDNELLMMLRAEKKKAKDVYLYDSIGSDKEGNEINLFDIIEYKDEDVVERLMVNERVGRLGKIMEERGIKMGLGLGGITTPMCNLLAKGLIDKIVDTQDFDMGAIESIKKNPNHIEISASEYANPFNKGAYVNKLDFVILAALEVDVNFNCNVVVGSDGMITGAQGGHPDTAAGAKCTIVIAPLLQGRIPAICTNVTTVTTPGESVDVVITDYGIAINPRRQDLIECMKDVDLPFCTIKELRDKAYAMVGTPDPVQFDDRVVGVIEARDGTIIDVVRKIKDYEFEDEQ